VATIPELQTALAANPESWELRLELVEALVAEGRHETAVEMVNQGEALPREAGPWLAAAKCYGAVGALEQAAGLVASALEIEPGHEPSLAYQAELEAAYAAMPVALTADDVDDNAVEVAAVGPPPPTVAPVIVALQGSDDGAIMLPRVTFANHEMEALKAAEEEAKRRMEATIRRDKMNSVMITVLLHVLIVGLLIMVGTQVPPNVPPQIVASSPAESPEDQVEDVTMEKPTVDPNTAVNTSVVDIVTVAAESSLSLSNLDVPVSDMAMEQVVSFNPSMSLGMPTSSESKMMFGQPMEGNVLGVIMDVSGSMGEYLPAVVREVDRAFENSPIVYVRNMLVRNERSEGEIRLIVPEEVIPTHPEYRTRTPYWFLWHDLPRRTPQRYVDRIIETFKTRDNQFLAIGGSDRSRLDDAIKFLMEENIDALYIFSDFEDFIDDDMARTFGQMLGRRKIRTYVQPALGRTEHLDTLTRRVANRTFGREMPPLVTLLRGDSLEPEEKSNLMPRDRTEPKPEVDFDFTLATPRDEMITSEFFAFRPSSSWYEIHRLSEPEYDAVFYGPEARVAIFLKDSDGKYIQNPFEFRYHSRKEIPDHPDPRYRTRTRKFEGLEETPSFDGEEIVWKMILEDDLKFRVHLYLGRKGMNATYVADPPTDGTSDSAFIYFSLPRLAQERNDRYYGYDLPAEGVRLDDVRAVVHPNEVTFNLPRQDRDRFRRSWEELGFEPGYTTINYIHGMRRPPSGIRDLVVQGPSFGPRKFRARTTSSRILLTGGAWRADIEPWESFYARLSRPSDRRRRFTKTEAIEIEIE